MGTRHATRAVAAVAIGAVLVLLATACEPSGPWTKVKVAGFTPYAHNDLNSVYQDQGAATVHTASGTTKVIYTGEVIDKSFTDDGWTHVGDPDSHAGYIVYPYQASDPADGKMFAVVTPHGRTFRYTHALGPSEEYNNSFATVSPDGQWLVSGEWDTESRLLVFPMPILNSSVPVGDAPLPIQSTIELDHPVTQIQGCDFVTPTRLICSADDAKKQLLAVDLSAPLSGSNVTGTVTSIGKIPLFSKCKDGFEAEGVDYDAPSKLLRVNVIQPKPCFIHTDEYVYRATS
jgi:hypothetical protein